MLTGTKTPDETKDFSLDWWPDIGSDVVPNGASSSWSSVPAGLTVTQSNIGTSPSSPAAQLGSLTTAWLTGGAVGQVYYVKNQITTTSGRVLTKVLRVLVELSNII